MESKDLGAFYERVGENLFRASGWTRGPWSPAHQHAGPPSALVAGRLAELAPDAFRVLRVTVEIMRPVPIGRLRVESTVRRDGRAAKVLEGRLWDEDDKLLLFAEALALEQTDLDIATSSPPLDEPHPDQSQLRQFPFFEGAQTYAEAMELRFGRGDFGSGDVMAWLRMRVALIDGCEPTPLERVLVAADSGNGVSQRLDTRAFSFVNPDLVVTLHRPAEGEWIGLAARTDLSALGTGVADTRLYDAQGPIGRGVQTLLVRKARS